MLLCRVCRKKLQCRLLTDVAMNALQDRLQKIVRKKGFHSVRSFEMYVGLPNGFVGKAKQITEERRSQIQKSFPDLNMGWLLTGEGSMLREQPQVQFSAVQNNTNSPHATMYANHGDVHTIKDIPTTKDAAPLVPIELTRKENTDIYNEMMGKANELMSEHITKVNVFSDIDFYFSVYDDSMNPTFVRGDILALRHLDKEQFIVNGNPYVLDTKSHGMLLRVLKNREDHYECSVLDKSDRYESFDVPKADVYMVYNIKGMLRTSF